MKMIGIIGSRRRDSLADYNKVRDLVLEFWQDGDKLVSGGCPSGADNFAERIAKKYQIPIMIHYAQWQRKGKAAGFIRNTDIAEDADILIACVAGDRKGGTEDTIIKFKNLGKKQLILC